MMLHHTIQTASDRVCVCPWAWLAVAYKTCKTLVNDIFSSKHTHGEKQQNNRNLKHKPGISFFIIFFFFFSWNGDYKYTGKMSIHVSMCTCVGGCVCVCVCFGGPVWICTWLHLCMISNALDRAQIKSQCMLNNITIIIICAIMLILITNIKLMIMAIMKLALSKVSYIYIYFHIVVGGRHNGILSYKVQWLENFC